MVLTEKMKTFLENITTREQLTWLWYTNGEYAKAFLREFVFHDPKNFKVEDNSIARIYEVFIEFSDAISVDVYPRTFTRNPASFAVAYVRVVLMQQFGLDGRSIYDDLRWNDAKFAREKLRVAASS